MKDKVWYVYGESVQEGTIEKITIRYGDGAYNKHTIEPVGFELPIFQTEAEAKKALKEKLQRQMEELKKKLEKTT